MPLCEPLPKPKTPGWPNFAAVAHNFTTSIPYNGGHLLAVIVSVLRGNGMHYEINLPGFPRFWVRWGATDKYELARPLDARLPDALLLAVSDAIESELGH